MADWERYFQGEKKGQQPLLEVPRASGHEQVQLVAEATFEIIPPQSMVAFEVAYERLDSSLSTAALAFLVTLVAVVPFERGTG